MLQLLVIFHFNVKSSLVKTTSAVKFKHKGDPIQANDLRMKRQSKFTFDGNIPYGMSNVVHIDGHKLWTLLILK